MLALLLGRRWASQDENRRRTQDDDLNSDDPGRRIEKPSNHGGRDYDNDRGPLRFSIDAAVPVPVVDQRSESPVFSQPAIQPF